MVLFHPPPPFWIETLKFYFRWFCHCWKVCIVCIVCTQCAWACPPMLEMVFSFKEWYSNLTTIQIRLLPVVSSSISQWGMLLRLQPKNIFLQKSFFSLQRCSGRLEPSALQLCLSILDQYSTNLRVLKQSYKMEINSIDHATWQRESPRMCLQKAI